MALSDLILLLIVLGIISFALLVGGLIATFIENILERQP